MKPTQKPQNNCFSSGPCSKFPGWNLDKLAGFNPGRSHRAKAQKEKLNQIITQTKKLLNIPEDYLVGIMPASDTGAVEAALWSLIGQRGVDVFCWESFSKDWAIDLKSQLKIKDLRIIEANYGKLPDMKQADSDRDIVFTYNGTTSGVKVKNCDFISDKRKGLTICDATSAVFAMDLPWAKLDATTFSWQKVMGGEAAHGMLVLSPRAVARLESYIPSWPVPKIFRLTKNSKIISGIFSGATINTPSMLAAEDALVTLAWVEEIGGLKKTIERSEANLKAISSWVDQSAWIDFLAEDPETISNTSICLKITDPDYLKLSEEEQGNFAKDLTSLLEKEDVAYDIDAYRDAPAGIRIWGGATIESSDLETLTKWLDYAFAVTKEKYNKAA